MSDLRRPTGFLEILGCKNVGGDKRTVDDLEAPMACHSTKGQLAGKAVGGIGINHQVTRALMRYAKVKTTTKTHDYSQCFAIQLQFKMLNVIVYYTPVVVLW